MVAEKDKHYKCQCLPMAVTNLDLHRYLYLYGDPVIGGIPTLKLVSYGGVGQPLRKPGKIFQVNPSPTLKQ